MAREFVCLCACVSELYLPFRSGRVSRLPTDAPSRRPASRPARPWTTRPPAPPKGSPGLAPGGRTAPATSPVAPSTPEPPKPTATAKFYVDLFSTAFKAYQVKG